MQKFYKGILVLFILLLSGITLKAQDVIIKNNKEEIKAKVLEIEEYNIKYKKFEFQDGPTYSIKKSEVFMILYKNGTRETFPGSQQPVNTPSNNTTQTPVPQYQPPVNSRTNDNVPPVITPSNQPSANKNTGPSADDAVAYAPSRLLFGYSSVEDIASTFTMVGSSDGRLVKNWLNWGVSVAFSVTSFDDYDETGSLYSAGVFAAGYLPVNRLLSSYESQDKGFFPFVQLGTALSHLSVPTVDADGDEVSASSTGFTGIYNFGLDYRFSQSFGLSVATDIRSLTSGFIWGINFEF